MSFFRLILRGLVYHRRLHAAVLLGVVLTCGILTGALIVGDSVDYSLRQIATLRLGRIAYALNWTNRFFAQDLAGRIAQQDARIKPVAVLALRGMASNVPGQSGVQNQLNRVQVLGVDEGLWRFAPDNSAPISLGPQEAALNEKTAAALGLKAGDDFLLRVVKTETMPIDAPLSSQKNDRTAAGLVTVKVVLPDAQLGRFSLAANQSTPYNVFVERTWLQEQAGLAGQANLLVADDAVPLEELRKALDAAWALDDVGLRLRTSKSGIAQLESARVFLDKPVVDAATQLPGAEETLTYLVNSISKGGRATPYSFVEAGPVPAQMLDSEVIINEWLAEQLGAKAGDSIEMAYYQLEPTNALVERKRTFTVRSVAPMEVFQIERELAPQFPGLSDVENCRDWNVGMPMDPEKLKDAPNEAYWRQYGQTPKLLVTLKAGQEMWGNRFGNATAIRFRQAANVTALRNQIRERLSAAKLGLDFMPVKKIAQEAVAQAMDFGGLFIGMSMFLIVAALILLGILYVFGIQQRGPEMGILLAVGFSRRTVRCLFFFEACLTALAGTIPGAVAGAAYAWALIGLLARYWPGAVAGTTILFHAGLTSIATGISLSLSLAFGVLLLTVMRATRRCARELLTTDLSSEPEMPLLKRRPWIAILSTGSVLLAVATALYAWLSKPADMVEPFFTAGTFLLLAGLGYYWWLLGYLARRSTFQRPRLWKIAVTNLARRRGRSLSVTGLTACGCFLVFAVSSMQENVALHANERSSGTGGFQVFAQTTVPITGSAAEVCKKLGVDAVPLRVRDGDDAGCLNLNHAQTPRLFGVDAQRLSDLGAFTGGDYELWKRLERQLPEGQISAMVGDTDTALWGLKKKLGDVIPYHDEAGNECTLKIVGMLPMRLSVFQGSLLISDEAFTRLFPSEGGFRAVLINATPDKTDVIAARLNRTFEKFGMEAVPAVQRLREFYAVESTYLAMFLVLGGLGLLLGAGGVGIVVLRNVFERRAETSLLYAVGYDRKTLVRLLFLEHGLLALPGMALGALAAAGSILPLAFLSQTTASPGILCLLFVFIAAANLASIDVVLLLGLPRNLLAGLRTE